MARQGISIDLETMDEVAKGLKGCQRELAKGARRTMIDLASRGVNTVVRNEVSRVYNIKKKDIEGGARHYKHESGSVNLAGVTIPTFDVVYKGRMLTPTHFGMTPKARPAGNRRYTVKWKPFRAGGRRPLAGDGEQPAFLQASGDTAIPYQRTGKARYPIKAVKRLSVPIMIENDKVSPHIEDEILKRMAKGFGRYAK